MGDATLAGSAFFSRVRGPFRLLLCRGRDFHRSSHAGETTMSLAYEGRRPGMWGRSARASMPRVFQSQRQGRMGGIAGIRRAVQGRREETTSTSPEGRGMGQLPARGTAQQRAIPSQGRPSGVSQGSRITPHALPSIPNQAPRRERQSMTRPSEGRHRPEHSCETCCNA